MFFKIVAFKNIANFTGKIPVLGSLFKKVGLSGLQLYKKRPQLRCFPIKFIVF